jgi:hypothetical protein
VPTSADAAAYAQFLDTYSTALHAAGLLVSVDVASWSPIWNIPLIARTAVDYIFTMNTYTDNDTAWLRDVNQLTALIPPSKLFIGLETTRASDGLPYPDAVLAMRFQRLKQLGVKQLGLWDAPVPDNWWPFLRSLADDGE